MTIAFEKYHGLGNDYLVIELVIEDPEERVLVPDAIRRICDRTLGVGSDGILLPGPGQTSPPFSLRIFNPDGSEAEKSGNGLRIFARYLFDRGRVDERPFAVETAGGNVVCQVLAGGAAVRVEMGRVRFDSLEEKLEIDGESLVISVVSLGNPHCVVFRDELREPDILRLGPLLENAPRFPARTNVQLAKVVDPGTLALEIWERGAGHTRASGSSSCAAAAVAHKLGFCDQKIEVVMPGGALSIEIGDDDQIVQQGPVVHVASGVIHDEALRLPFIDTLA